MRFFLTNDHSSCLYSTLNKKKETKKSIIFEKNINHNFKLTPFKTRTNKVGSIKYFSPSTKEWKNSIYLFNNNNLKNLTTHSININSLIKSYFNLYFNNKFFNNTFISRAPKKNPLSLNKIFVSKAEIKHTNSKAIITIYTYNREKVALLKKINYLKKRKFFFLKRKNLFFKKISLLLNKSNESYSLGQNSSLYNKTIRALIYKELLLIRKLKLKLSLNKSKFEEVFLHKLSKLISKFYNKKVEFNIINLKSVVLNSDFFTKILALKLRDRNTSPVKTMKAILNKVFLPKVNSLQEKSPVIKTVDFNLIENKYEVLNIRSIIKNNDLDKLLNELYYSIIINNRNDYKKIYETIFNSIKYKNMEGIKLEVKGRLTKRYRADRAIFKFKWKGGLRNIDSSYKGLSTANIRGYLRPNVEYSIFTSKRRVGAFAVKGWIGGK